MIEVTIVGAPGYAGSELVRLLSSHPNVAIKHVTSQKFQGERLGRISPWLATDLVLEEFTPDLKSDLFFLCQQCGFASEVVPELSKKSRIIDLSADFRLTDQQTFESTYNVPFAGGKLDNPAVYGLPEVCCRDAIRKAQVIANPGCYPTASLLGLVPLLRAGLVSGSPVIDAKSGASGAGRSRHETHFLMSELSGNFHGYAMTDHRHKPEIEQIAGIGVRFTPHLLPIARGLEASIYVELTEQLSSDQLNKIFQDFYQNEPFVRCQAWPPSVKQVVGSNRCDLFGSAEPSRDDRPPFAVISTVIDNLIKGSSGQAIQNMNMMFGFPETTGLPMNGIWP